ATDAVPEKAAPADAAPPADDPSAPKDEAPPETEEKPAGNAAPKDAGQEETKESAPPDESGCDEPVVDEVAAPEPQAVPADEAAQKTDEPQPAPTEPNAGDETPEITPKTPAPPESAKPATDPPVADNEGKPAIPVTTPQEPAPPVDPKAEAQKQYLQELGKYEAEKSGFADALKSWEDRGKDGQKLAKELSTRFGAWYYVISADSFEKLRPSRADVVGPKEAPKPADTGTPPQFDSLPGGIPGLGE
ncbi:MAG: hypothetical protein WKF77_32425, partial [Planctomycetaceae bacterium]